MSWCQLSEAWRPWLQEQLFGQNMPRLCGDAVTSLLPELAAWIFAHRKQFRIMWNTMTHRSVAKRMQVPRATLWLSQPCFNKHIGHTCHKHSWAPLCSFHLSHPHCMAKKTLELMFLWLRSVCAYGLQWQYDACGLWVTMTAKNLQLSFTAASIPAAAVCFCTEPSWLNGATLTVIGHGRILRYSVP